MNLQDCIDIIKNCTTLACEYHIKDKCQYGYEVRENRFECAKELAINALEKQIAKKVNLYIGEVPSCPGCNTRLQGYKGFIIAYCKGCGQLLTGEGVNDD